ncbi:MAG: manganese efflux pump MntP [Pseudomonadota bacterium]|nr:manganese efflux pump MntP [Pseudomonadota bacterium]
MTITALIFLALAMSTDAFAAALGKGAAMQKPRFLQALRIGLLFGCIEAITPIIGWLLGSFASKWISQWDHWLAFFLLLGLGGHMIWAGLHGTDEDQASPVQQGVLALALTAVATSIDAMAVGVGLAFINVNILYAALAIGTATTVMVTLGVMLGRMMGAAIGKKAELIGGVILILVGATILYEHLSDEAALARAGKMAPQSQSQPINMVS